MLSAKIAYAAVSAAGILLAAIINTTFYLNYYRFERKIVPGSQNYGKYNPSLAKEHFRAQLRNLSSIL